MIKLIALGFDCGSDVFSFNAPRSTAATEWKANAQAEKKALKLGCSLNGPDAWVRIAEKKLEERQKAAEKKKLERQEAARAKKEAKEKEKAEKRAAAAAAAAAGETENAEAKTATRRVRRNGAAGEVQESDPPCLHSDLPVHVHAAVERDLSAFLEGIIVTQGSSPCVARLSKGGLSKAMKFDGTLQGNQVSSWSKLINEAGQGRVRVPVFGIWSSASASRGF